MEHHRRQHQNGRVHQKRDRQRQHRIDRVEFDRPADSWLARLQLPRLDESRVQVKVVRHDRGADDAYGNDDHALLAEPRRQQSPAHLREIGMGLRQNKNFDEKTNPNGEDENQDDRLNEPHPQSLQGQQQQHIEGGNEDGPRQRNAKEEIDGHRAAQHFSQVASANGNLTGEPVRPARPRRVEVAARLGQNPCPSRCPGGRRESA